MRIEEEVGGVQRRLDIEPAATAGPSIPGRSTATERPFDAAGRNWLRRMLLRFVRGTGYAADERVALILKRQGADGVFAEISQLPSDYVKAIYFKKLLRPPRVWGRPSSSGLSGRRERRSSRTTSCARRSPPRPDLRTAPDPLPRRMRRPRGPSSPTSSCARPLRAGGEGAPRPKSTAAILLAAQKIDSDFELAELLTTIARKNGLGDPVVQQAYAAAVNTVDSSFERHRALGALVDRGDLSPAAVGMALQLVRGIDSDFERASVLVEIAEHYPLAGAARDAYLDITATISSGYERERAEAALGSRGAGGRFSRIPCRCRGAACCAPFSLPGGFSLVPVHRVRRERRQADRHVLRSSRARGCCSAPIRRDGPRPLALPEPRARRPRALRGAFPFSTTVISSNSGR